MGAGRWLAILLVFFALGIAGDLTAGIYAIGAQIGFYTTMADLLIVRSELRAAKRIEPA